MRHPVLMVTTTVARFESVNLEIAFDKIVIFIDEELFGNKHKIIMAQEVCHYLENIAKQHKILCIGLISKADCFNPHEIKKEINYLIRNGVHKSVSLLVPYLKPPLYESREDGAVQSGLFDFGIFKSIILKNEPLIFSVIIFNLLTDVSGNEIVNEKLKTFQVGRSTIKVSDQEMAAEQLSDTVLMISQTGKTKPPTDQLISSYLKKAIIKPHEAHIVETREFSQISKLSTTRNKHHNQAIHITRLSDKECHKDLNCIIENTTRNFAYFQNLNDTSFPERFISLFEQMEKRNLDMIGSHVLQLEPLKQKVVAVRFPLEITRQFLTHYLDVAYVPAVLISKQAFLKSGGFSNTKEIDYNAQFLFRCLLKLNIGNVDDFLYLSAASGDAGSEISDLDKKSGFYKWRWQVDYKLVTQGKLELSDSSLQLM